MTLLFLSVRDFFSAASSLLAVSTEASVCTPKCIPVLIAIRQGTSLKVFLLHYEQLPLFCSAALCKHTVVVASVVNCRKMLVYPVV